MKVELDLPHHELADWVKANRAVEEQHKLCYKWLEDNCTVAMNIEEVTDKDWLALYNDWKNKANFRDGAKISLVKDIFDQLKLKDFQVFTSEE